MCNCAFHIEKIEKFGSLILNLDSIFPSELPLSTLKNKKGSFSISTLSEVTLAEVCVLPCPIALELSTHPVGLFTKLRVWAGYIRLLPKFRHPVAMRLILAE